LILIEILFKKLIQLKNIFDSGFLGFFKQDLAFKLLEQVGEIQLEVTNLCFAGIVVYVLFVDEIKGLLFFHTEHKLKIFHYLLLNLIDNAMLLEIFLLIIIL